MHETRLLRRVIHYIWECFRVRGEMKIRLKNYQGDELHVDEDSNTGQITVRYFAKQPTGELVKQIEAVCFIMRYGEWIPLQLYQFGNDTIVYASANPETGEVDVLDHAGQVWAVGQCDTWALQLLEEGFLASAAKLNPLGKRPNQRPKWPAPTVSAPDFEQIEEWTWEDGGCEASDGCWTEVDGICPHGPP